MVAVEDVEEALLRGLHQGGDGAAVLLDVDEGGGGVGVVVPEVVVDELAGPDEGAGVGVEGGDGGDDGKVRGNGALEEVGAGRGDRNVEEAALGIDRHGGPDVGGAGLAADFRREGVEGPSDRAGAGVEGIDRAGAVDGLGPVLAGPAEEEGVAEDRRRLQERERPPGVGGVEAVEVEHAALAEVGAGRRCRRRRRGAWRPWCRGRCASGRAGRGRARRRPSRRRRGS